MGARRDRRRRPTGRIILAVVAVVALAYRQQRLHAADAAFPHIARPV